MTPSRDLAQKLLSLIPVILVATTGAATAVEFRAGQNIVIAAGEVIEDDLYATGDTLTVDGIVHGDLVASGRLITINGEVTADLIAAGQAVTVNGRVGDDVRMAGMALELGPEASIGDDVVAAGFSLATVRGSSAGGSLLFSGYQALLEGNVGGGIRGSMSSLEINGSIGGDGKVEVSGSPGTPGFVQYLPSPIPLPVVAGGLTIGAEAVLEGELEYTSDDEARGPGVASATLSRERRTWPDQEAQAANRGSVWTGRLFKWLGLLLLGLLIAWRAPGWLDNRHTEIETAPWALAGIGFVATAALPVVIAILVVVAGLLAALLGALGLGSLAAPVFIVGLVLGILLVLLFWLTVSYLAPVLVGLCAGRWLLGRFAAERAKGLVLPLFAGLLVLGALRIVPFLGFLVLLAVVFLGWGTMLAWLWRRLPRGAAA
jgi:hypothetical protein